MDIIVKRRNQYKSIGTQEARKCIKYVSRTFFSTLVLKKRQYWGTISVYFKLEIIFTKCKIVLF